MALSLAAGILLAGCASQPELMSQVQPVNQTVFRLVDERSGDVQQTRVEHMGGNMIRYVLGDDRVRPSVPKMLEAFLYNTAGSRLANKTVQVRSADIRIYQLTGSNMTYADRVAYTPSSTSPEAFIGGLLISDLLDMSFAEKRIEVEINGLVDGKEIKVGEYDYYTLGSPEKKTMQMLDAAMQKFAQRIP